MHTDRDPLNLDCRELQGRLKDVDRSPGGRAARGIDQGIAGFALTEAETRHMDGCEACMRVLVESALSEKPAVVIPEDFARRVSALAPVPTESMRRALRQTRASRLAAIFSLILVLAALAVLLLVPGRDLPVNGSMLLTFETLMAIEAAGLAWWLAGRGRTR
jgi:hypothetical protein